MELDKKTLFLTVKDFCLLTGYTKSHYYELLNDGQIIRVNSFVDSRASIEAILSKTPISKKLLRKRLVKAIKKIDEAQPDSIENIEIAQHQFANMLNLTYREPLPQFLSRFDKPPKCRDTPKHKYYNLEEIRNFIEDNKIMKFSNYWAQTFIRRKYLV